MSCLLRSLNHVVPLNVYLEIDMTPVSSFKRTLLSVCAGLAIVATAPVHSQEAAPNQNLRLGMGVDDIRTLDPYFSTSVGETPIVEFVYEGLTKFPDGVIDPARIQPALAESWNVSPDGLAWTFKLRKGVQFHGGHGEMTADDVIFSYERLKSDKTASPFRQNLAAIKKMEKVDPYTVRLYTEVPEPNLPALLLNANKGYIMSKAALEKGIDVKTHPVGTGPFEYAEYKPRESFRLKRNDAYWGGKPTLDSVTAQFMSNASTRELALRNGDVHAIEIAASKDAITRMRRANMEVDLTAPANAFILYFNPTIKPFDNIDVRKALSYATDRKSMLQFLGEEVSGEELSPLPSGYLGHNKNVAKYDFDPKKAKELLAKAGFPNGFSATVIVSNNNIYLPPMQIIQDQWRKVGVDLKLDVVDHPTYHRQIRQNLNPVVIYGAYRYPLDGNRYLNEFFHSRSTIGKPTASTNFSHYEKVDELLNKAQTEKDLKKRIEYWEQAQAIIMDDAMAIPLFTRKYAMARSPKLDLGHPQQSYAFYTFTPKTRLLK